MKQVDLSGFAIVSGRGGFFWPKIQLNVSRNYLFLRIAFFAQGRAIVWRFGGGRTYGYRRRYWFQWGGKPEGAPPQWPWGIVIEVNPK